MIKNKAIFKTNFDKPIIDDQNSVTVGDHNSVLIKGKQRISLI